MTQLSPLTGQFRTWIEHGAIAAAIPSGVVALTGLLHAGFAVSTLVLVVFVIREGWDVAAHKKAGDWTKPEEGTGVTPQADQHGDLVGPISVWVTFLLVTLAMA